MGVALPGKHGIIASYFNKRAHKEGQVNVLISVDMEGIAGVVNDNHTSSDHREYERFRKLMTA